jgi:hypothetical protein
MLSKVSRSRFFDRRFFPPPGLCKTTATIDRETIIGKSNLAIVIMDKLVVMTF